MISTYLVFSLPFLHWHKKSKAAVSYKKYIYMPIRYIYIYKVIWKYLTYLPAHKLQHSFILKLTKFLHNAVLLDYLLNPFWGWQDRRLKVIVVFPEDPDLVSYTYMVAHNLPSRPSSDLRGHQNVYDLCTHVYILIHVCTRT